MGVFWINAICRNSYESRCIINKTYYGNGETPWIVDPKFFYHCFTTKRAKNDSDWPEVETYIRTVENYTTMCDNCTHSAIFLKEVGIPVTSEMGKYVWVPRNYTIETSKAKMLYTWCNFFCFCNGAGVTAVPFGIYGNRSCISLSDIQIHFNVLQGDFHEEESWG